MKKPDQQHIHAELVKLCNGIPKILTVVVMDIDGDILSYHSKNDTFDEKLQSVTIYKFRLAGEHLASDLGIEDWQYCIAAGSNGFSIYIPIGLSDYSLILIVPTDSAVDELWPILEPHYKSIAKYF